MYSLCACWRDILHICYDRNVNIAFVGILLLSTISVILVILVRRQRDTLAQSARTIADLTQKLTKSQSDVETERSQVLQNAQSMRLTNSIVSQLGHGVLCIDQKGSIQFANPQAERLLGSSPLVGTSYREALHTLKIGGTTDFSFFEAALAGSGYRLPDTVELDSPRGTIPLTASLSPLVSDSAGPMILFLFSDNSQGAAGIAEEKAFFSAAAHELRTPLTVIRFAVSLLMSKLDTFSKEQILDHLKKIDISSEQLLNLVNDLLNVSRIDQGRLVVEKIPFDMVSLTDEVIKELTVLASAKKLYLHHDQESGDSRMVIGDKVKAKEVLTNLISNGVKYTIQGGVTVAHRQREGSFVTTVTDTGSGIPAVSQSLLFRRFLQVGSAREQTSAKSSGLGLYISRKFAQLMGGDVTLESSEPGKGSTFAFRLPLG